MSRGRSSNRRAMQVFMGCGESYGVSCKLFKVSIDVGET